MLYLLCSRLVCASLLVLLISTTACSTVRTVSQSAEFDPSQVDCIAVVLSHSGITTRGIFNVEPNFELADTLRTKVELFIGDLAGHFGVDVVDAARLEHLEIYQVEDVIAAYRKVRSASIEALRARKPLNVVVPPNLVHAGATAECRYMAMFLTLGWRMTTANQALHALAGATPQSGLGVEMLVVDRIASRVVWFGQHYADMDPARDEHVRAVTAALMLELFTGRRVSAFSFTGWLEDVEVNVWLQDGNHVWGRLQRINGLDVVLQTSKDEEQRIPLEHIRSVQEALTARRLFPAQKPSAEHPRVF